MKTLLANIQVMLNREEQDVKVLLADHFLNKVTANQVNIIGSYLLANDVAFLERVEVHGLGNKEDLVGYVDVTEGVTEALLDEVFDRHNNDMGLSLGIPEDVIKHFDNKLSKVKFADDGSGMWTRRGFIPFPIVANNGRVFHVSGKSATLTITSDGIPDKVITGSTDVMLTGLANYANEFIFDYGLNESIAYNLSRLGGVTVRGVPFDTLAEINKMLDNDMSKPITENIDGTKEPYNTEVCLPISNFMSLLYMGNGYIGNTYTGQVIEPTVTSGGLFYIVPEYLGVEGNDVKMPFEVIQNSIHYFTASPNHHVSVSGRWDEQPKTWGDSQRRYDSLVMGSNKLSEIKWWRKK